MPQTADEQMQRWSSRLRADQRGINLIEVMIVTVISTVVMAGILVVFNAGRNVYDTTEAKLTIREETRKAFAAIGQDLREAKLTSYCLDATGGTACPGGLTTSLTFQQPALNVSADPGSFFDPTTLTGTITWGATDVAYKWARNAATPQSFFRCSPSTDDPLATPPGAGCRAIAFRVSQLSLTPLDASGANFAVPVPPALLNLTTTATPPAIVQVSIWIAPAQTANSGRLAPYLSTDRIVLRNPQR